METNKKYEEIYNKALQKVAPEWDGETYICDENGNYAPATPIGYDDEQLEFDALNDVIQTAFTKDKDYVCWSDGGYSKESGDILETLEGEPLKKYDPVLILGNFGEPQAFMMYGGECNEEGDYLRPLFYYINSDDEVKKYRPKVYVPRLSGEKKPWRVIENDNRIAIKSGK